MKKLILLILVVPFLICFNSPAQALVWGVNPNSTDAQLINLNPFDGSISNAFSLAGMITANDTEIGLAGYADSLYYTNADYNNGSIYTIDPTNGATTDSFSVSGGWEIDGLGYYSNSDGSWLYTSGCSVYDVHRYVAADGSGPQFFWSSLSDPLAMAGDNGGRIFSYGYVGQRWGIYEINPLTNTSASWFAGSPSDSIVGMAFDGTYLYLSDMNNLLYTMDTSGNVINTLDLGYTLYALGSTEGSSNPVPEPATLFLLGSGLLGLGINRCKKKKK